MRPVVWSRRALTQTAAQVAFIARDNRIAALRIADAIRDAGNALGEISTGRPGHLPGTYEKLVARLPYILIYRVEERRIIILRVIHTARNRP